MDSRVSWKEDLIVELAGRRREEEAKGEWHEALLRCYVSQRLQVSETVGGAREPVEGTSTSYKVWVPSQAE